MAVIIATVAMAFVAVLGILGAAIRWFYNRGRNEQAIASSIDKQAEATTRNTSATIELAAQVGGLRETLASHSQTLTEHHFRLKVLEDAK